MTPRIVLEIPEELPEAGLDALADLILDKLEREQAADATPPPATTPTEATNQRPAPARRARRPRKVRR